MKVLCVAEKPSIAKGITNILSNGRWETKKNRKDGMPNYCFPFNLNGENCDMVVTAVIGHLMNYDFSQEYQNWRSCQPMKLFEAPIVRNVYKHAKSVADNLRKESKNAQKLIIWTDCDREGENIGSEISDVCKENNRFIDVYRARFSVVQEREILNACRSLVRLDTKQVDAVNVRIELDLRIGASFTRFQTLNFQRLFSDLNGKVISYGTCQFPTLGFVVSRYLQIQNFVSEDFWKIEVSHNKNNSTVSFNWKREKLFDRFICFIYYEKCMKNCLARVVSMIQKPKSKWKPLPLTTIDLIKLGSKFLKISSDEIMTIAESLYNRGFISYPRTETDQFKDDFDLNSLIKLQTNNNNWGDYAQSLLQGKFVKPRKGKSNDQAHPPIHPTKPMSESDNFNVKEKKVYEFITRRFLACCSDDAKGSETVVTINIAGELFTANGLMIIEENYLKIYVYDKWGEKSIPLYQEGETFIPTKLEMTKGNTVPPKPLTEPDLIGLMDKNGIGTDATIHEHIKKIKDREYIYEENRYLYPTTLGIALIEGYNSVESDVSLTKPNLRKMLEESLQNICKGHQNKNDVLRNDLTMYKNVFEKISQDVTKISQAIEKYLNIKANYSNYNPMTAMTAMTVEPKYHNIEAIIPCPSCNEFTILQYISGNNILIACQNKHSFTIIQKVKYDSVKVIEERCNNCVNQPRKLSIVFSDEMVNQGFPKEYTGCICGCDNVMNSALKTNQRVFKLVSEAQQKNVALPPLPSSFQNNSYNNSNNNNNNNYTNNSFNNNNYYNNTTNNNNNSYNRSNFTTSNTTNNYNYTNVNTNFKTSGFVKGSEYNSNYGNGGASSSSSSNYNYTNNYNNDDDNPPNCPQCGQPTTELTVTKNNGNKGRKFYKCKNCDYFKWKDEFSKENKSSSSGINKIIKEQFENMDTLNENKPRCNCGLVAIGRIVGKEGQNKGRIFLCCRSKINKCKYFEWADELNLDKSIIEACMDSSFINHDSASSSTSSTHSNKRKWGGSGSTYGSSSSTSNKRSYTKGKTTRTTRKKKK